MPNTDLAIVILAAGKGTRMNSALPKVLHPIAGRAMIGHVLAATDALSPALSIVVVGPGMEAVERAVSPHATALQKNQLGTADAVKSALPALAGFDGTVLVVYADTPLLSVDTLRRLVSTHQASADVGVVVVGFETPNPGAYGRLIVDQTGKLTEIVEAKDASPAQLESRLCNSGVMAIDGRQLPGWLARINDKNAKQEFYLTDIVALARSDGRVCRHVLCDESEVLGVNDRTELARAERIVQERLRRRAMTNGATLIDPATVYFSFDTELGQDVVVEPGVRFGPGVRIGNGVEIRAYCHIEGAIVGDRAIVGPFARLRPGAALAQEAHVGNFVEVKNTSMGKGAKANHLTYLGDATVGADANIGAGTITCNYDGYLKHRTEIGAGAFIGSNTALVAPVRVGDGAVVGAGSTITQDVPADALAVERNEQRTVTSGGRLLRERKSAEKSAQQAAKSKPGKN